MVEPIGGILGAVSVGVAEVFLPYALAFAAGAMIYVVVDDLIPEAHAHGNSKLASAVRLCLFIVCCMRCYCQCACVLFLCNFLAALLSVFRFLVF